MLKKKLIASGICIMSIIGASGMTAFAEEPTGTKDIQVSYNNQSVIPDPEHPTNPTYQVIIPSSINFTDTNKTVSTNVSLKDAQGTGAYKGDAKVNVQVKSKNGYNVDLENGEDAVSYSMVYGDNAMKGTGENTVGQLTSANPEINGTAKLTGAASAVGNHTDILTYTVQQAQE